MAAGTTTTGVSVRLKHGSVTHATPVHLADVSDAAAALATLGAATEAAFDVAHSAPKRLLHRGHAVWAVGDGGGDPARRFLSALRDGDTVIVLVGAAAANLRIAVAVFW